MPLSSTTTKTAIFAGNGSTTSFSYGFIADAEGDVEIILITNSTRAEVIQTIVTHYTLTGIGNVLGGKFNMVTAPTSSQSVMARRKPTLTQGTNLITQGAYSADTHEDIVNKNVQISQYIDEILGRGITVAIGGTLGSGLELPEPVASNVLGWNAAATAIVNYTNAAVGIPNTHVDNVLIKTDGTNSGDYQVTGLVVSDGNNISGINSLFLDEQAAADADVVGDGQVWVRNDAPNTLMFTDDAGTDHVVSGATALNGLGTVDTIPLWTPDGNTLGNSALTQSGSDLTGAGNLTLQGTALLLSSSTGAGVNSLAVVNTDAISGSSHAVLKMTVATGDPFVRWILTSGQNYTMGIDNSNSDKFVGSVGAALGTANWLEVTTAGAVALPGTLASGALTVTGLMQSTTAGIGIAHTDGTLHVHTASCGAQSAPAAADDLVVENNASGGMTILTPDAASSEIVFGSPSRQTGAFIDWRFGNLAWQIGTATASAKVEIFSGNSVLAMTLNSTQDVEIPSGGLTVAGSLLVSGTAADLSSANVGFSNVLTVANTDSTDSASDAVMRMVTTLSTGGDPIASWAISATQTYLMGIDNSDSDKFVGSVGTVLGTANWLEVTTAGAVTMPNDLTVAGAVSGVTTLAASGQVTIGTSATARGILLLEEGLGGNTAGYITLTSRNGTIRTLWIEDDGTLKLHTKAPVNNSDGVVVGAQT